VRDELVEAADRSSYGVEIQRVFSAEDVEDQGTGKATLRIADVMGEPDIGGRGSVFVFGEMVRTYLPN
jgi:hypothetical protein